MRTLRPILKSLQARRLPTLGTVANASRRLSRSIVNRQKLRIWLQQGSRCKACDVVHALTECELDHTQPLCDGGDVGDHNAQVLCRECHRAKTDAEIKARAARD